MATRMLIDARHPEETRVAVLKGNRIEEFDFESAEHKQIKGNIYLAKVTRVEPSLQAAFVDFGGNRHGFLAFGEIHPDYYQIPAEDRARLIAEEQEAADEEAALRAEEDDDDDDYEGDGYGGDDGYDSRDDDDHGSVEEIDTSEKDDVATIEDGLVANGDDDDDDDGEDGEDGEYQSTADDEDAGDDDSSDEDRGARDYYEGDEQDDRQDGEDAGSDESGETNEGDNRRRGRGRGRGGDRGGERGRGGDRGQGRGGDRGGDRGGRGDKRQGRRQGGGSRAKEIDDVRAKRQALRRRYKIQDVIQRRQVLLVQVVKEERGNKGAALTTYLSLAGRYCVLMPNSSNGGGISRKISSGADRKRLKQIVNELTLPRSMGLIVRTAGLQRNKTEIKRDFDYLARLWDGIRENTLKSSAPAAIHSDSDLIKRAIRDIYNREIEEVVVEGEEGYRSARDFMKLLMPSHVRRVKAYSDPVPLFQRYGAEDQLSAMYDPVVQLKSGGYLVINPTEALVSIDINSGRSTKEHGIEATALNTNLEAAREIARQLRLRDMAGLVVIDFIDMEHTSNIRKVERAMKDSLKNDRARIQVGRISGFGLMEMSRQRLRTGVLEATTRSCPHCDGTGLVRTASSASLSALRLIEDEAAKGKGTVITLYASTEAAIYLLNAKRADLAEIEHRYGVIVQIVPEGEDEGAKMRVISSGPRPTEPPKFEPIVFEAEDDLDDEIEEDEDEEEEAEERRPRDREDRDDDRGGRDRKRRRRRGGRNRNGEREDGADAETRDDAVGEPRSDDGEAEGDAGEGDEQPRAAREGEEEARDGERPKKRRRRGGRGRGRRREGGDGEGAENGADDDGQGDEAQGDDAQSAEDSAMVAAEAEEAPKPKRRSRAKKVADVVEPVAEDAPAPVEEAPVAIEDAAAEEAPAPKRRSRAKKAEAEVVAEPEAEAEAAPAAEAEDEAAAKPQRAPRRAKAKAEDAEAPATLEPEAGAPTDGEARRGGWWQRTFGQ